MKSKLLFALCMWVLSVAPLFGSVEDDAAKRIMQTYGRRLQSGAFEVGEIFGNLYVKEYVDVKKQSLWLNLIPDLTRFDSKKQKYLTEVLYEIHYVNNAVPDIRRKSHITSFKRGSGEIDRVLSYLNPDYLKETLFKEQYLSPIYPTNYKYYKYFIDSTYVSTDGSVKILFKQRFDNIRLLTSGWVVLDNYKSVRSFCAEGWDEQSDFRVQCTMGTEGLERFVVKEIDLDIYYNFAFNKLDISVEAYYDYSVLSNSLNDYSKKKTYDLTGSLNNRWGDEPLLFKEHISTHRKRPLSSTDSLIYINKKVITVDSVTTPPTADIVDETERKNNKVLRWLWNVGDEMISSHYLNWGDSDLKVYPLINPSYLRYSTGKGVTYKFAVNLRSRSTSKKSYYLKPMIGYSFKRKEVYWGIGGNYVYNPRSRGIISFSANRENSIYRELEIEKIENMPFENIHFPDMSFVYYRDTRFNLNVQKELFNGFEMQLGATLYYRSMSGNVIGAFYDGEKLQKRYKNFAPNLQLVWHPGMYHYYDGNRKVNLGSDMPRFSLNVEQGIRGVLGSKSVYTRAEFDAQHKIRVSSSADLYTRLGFGGYLYEKDTYFINYTFLKDNILPLDKNDELSGIFQLLDSEWYNSANKYFRLNAAYVSPFIVLQKLLPQVNIFKNEMLFYNMLFLSKLHPYSEMGYGVETPYLDFGIFAGFENYKFHKIGCKITISLFED